MDMDTRAQANRLLGSFNRTELQGIVKTSICGLVALGVVFGPGLLGFDPYRSLGPAGTATLGILVFAAALWVSEAMPAFAVAAPVLASLPKGSRVAKGLVLAVAAGANLGGIGTIIGTPPNAIAAGHLNGQVDFVRWMMVALPPALLLAAMVYVAIWRRYLLGDRTPIPHLDSTVDSGSRRKRHRITVLAVFAITVTMWMGESVIGIPSPVVSFLPIVALAVSGVIEARDMRLIPWDVLLLLAGGLSLGVGVEVTGLADWLASQVPAGLGPIGVAVVFSGLGLVLSNLMSNTAAAALLIPLGASLVSPEAAPLVIVSIAISCSAAMALPISTPPNAIAFGTERLGSRDFLAPGLIAGCGMAAVLPWLAAMF